MTALDTLQMRLRALRLTTAAQVVGEVVSKAQQDAKRGRWKPSPASCLSRNTMAAASAGLSVW